MSPTLTDNALTVLKKRYLSRDASGNITETPEEMFKRVSYHVAQAELNENDRLYWRNKFYDIMAGLHFLPNTPCLINAGRPFGMLSACFCLPLDDSLEDIFQTLKEAIMVQKMGGGTGFPLHNLRPKGDHIASTGHQTSGPISFLKVMDASMEIIRQGGVRHGANMAVMRVDHPDIEDFIDCKSKEGEIRNFNISVGTTDAFISAVRHNTDFNLINPRTGVSIKKINARGLWRKIAEGAWRNGEPGVIYLDEMNRHHPTPAVNKIDTTNPCGEQGLPAYDSCNLGSINLNHVLKPIMPGKYEIDYDKLSELTETCIRFLDDVITVNKYPIEKIEKASRASRRIGLGIMGLADALLLCHIDYASEEGFDLASNIMECINRTAHEYSRRLAKERGAFPLCEVSMYQNDPHRNATLTTIAPTGSISMLANCSSGCEPHFAMAFEKRILDGEKLFEINQAFVRLAKENGFWHEGLGAEIVKNGGSVTGLASVPPKFREMVRISSEIPAIDHVKMQAACQKHVDNSISKTINAPHSITVEEVEKVFMFAHEWGCRGLTFYREGSRSEVVLAKPEAPASKLADAIIVHATQDLPPRPTTMTGQTHKIRTGFGGMYITINRDKSDKISEVFVTSNDVGGEFRAWTEFSSRVISYALRMGVPLDLIIKAGKHIRGSKPIIVNGKPILSGPDAVAKVLEKEANMNVEVENESETICPECSSQLTLEEGCKKCHSCGYAACG